MTSSTPLANRGPSISRWAVSLTVGATLRLPAIRGHRRGHAVPDAGHGAWTTSGWMIRWDSSRRRTSRQVPGIRFGPDQAPRLSSRPLTDVSDPTRYSEFPPRCGTPDSRCPTTCRPRSSAVPRPISTRPDGSCSPRSSCPRPALSQVGCRWCVQIGDMRRMAGGALMQAAQKTGILNSSRIYCIAQWGACGKGGGVPHNRWSKLEVCGNGGCECVCCRWLIRSNTGWSVCGWMLTWLRSVKECGHDG